MTFSSVCNALFFFILSILFFSVSARADDNTRLYTVSESEKVAHQDCPGVTTYNPGKCIDYYYRFEIDMHGQLFSKEAGNCLEADGKTTQGYSEKCLVCQLDNNLQCRAGSQRFPNYSFAASQEGLSVNGSLMPWKDPQQASRLLPTITTGAEKNNAGYAQLTKTLLPKVCPKILADAAIQLKTDGSLLSNPLSQTCNQSFQDICVNPEAQKQLLAQATVNEKYKNLTLEDITGFCRSSQKQ